MANKSVVSDFKLDTQAAIKAAVYGTVAYVVLLVLVYILPSLFGILQLGQLIPVAVGYFYAMEIGKRGTPSYVDAAGGGAIAGAISAVINVVVLAIVGGLLASSVAGAFGGALFGFGMNAIVGSLLNGIIVGAILAAIGGAAYVFVKAQGIAK